MAYIDTDEHQSSFSIVTVIITAITAKGIAASTMMTETNHLIRAVVSLPIVAVPSQPPRLPSPPWAFR